jgi:hypothetical protein
VKKVIGMVVLGIGGLAAAIALTVGALALAGDNVGTVVQPTLVPSETRSRSSSPSKGDDHPSPTPSPSVDDHGGASVADDPSGSDDNSGSESSGSESSGSGSDSSGSGSGDSGSHDDD